MSDANQLREDPALRARLAAILSGGFAVQLLSAAVELGIPAMLANAPLGVDEIASRTATDVRAMRLAMEALAGLGVAERVGDGKYGLGEMGQLLAASAGVRAQARLLGREYFTAAGAMMNTLRTGGAAFKQANGESIYEYLGHHPEFAANFNEVMVTTSAIRYADVPAAFDFSRARNLIDVGGGHGALAMAILRAHPNLRATVFEIAAVAAGARERIADAGMADRCAIAAGDFFEAIPRGGDLYLMSSVLSNWDDDRAMKILRNCRAAMTLDTSLVLVEYGITAEGAPAHVAVMTLAALVIQGNVVRSEAEYRAMLAGAGFRIESIRPLGFPPYGMIHAVAM